MNLLSFDLNLLKVLSALLAEGSTIAAARRVGLSQPAVSQALARLRVSLGDPLFVRQGQRLVPTAFALGLADPLAALLTDLEGLLGSGETFDPAQAEVGFVMSGSDYMAEMLMPDLARRLMGEAPGVTAQLVELDPDDYLALLRTGRSDLALVPAMALHDWAEHEHLFDSRFAVIARDGHPATEGLTPGDEFPLDLFCALPHIAFSVEGKLATQSDAVLARMGHKRRVAMTAPDFSGLYRTVAATDMISVLPAELALTVAGETGIRAFRPPIPVGPVPIHMAWHRRSSQSAAHRWFRGLVGGILRRLPQRFGLKSAGQAVIPNQV